MNEKDKTKLYLEGARLLRDALDPPARPGHIATRPFSLHTCNRLDVLLALEKPTLEEARELFLLYQASRYRGAWVQGLPAGLEAQLKPIEEQIANLEKGGE